MNYGMKNYDLKIGKIDQIHMKAWKIWKRLKPFYHLLMDYIGYVLREKFHKHDDDDDGKIPAHWLRSLNGGQMDSIIDLIKPYPDQFVMINHTNRMMDDVVKIVADFYVQHGGFNRLPDGFWQNSNLITHDNGSCHPRTMNMYNGNDDDDVRMSICLQDGDFHYNFRRIIHELGHVYYFLETNHAGHRNLYRMTSNSAAHESIGELIRMAWNGCQLQNKQHVHQSHIINTLMEEALSTFVTIPFGMIIEEWRNQTFTAKNLDLADVNQFYWILREQIQNIRQPPPRPAMLNNQRILDPLFKYHVANFQPYWRYVFGVMLQHQFHQKICSHHHHHHNGWSSLVECCPQPNDFDTLRKLLRIDLMQQEFNDDNDLAIVKQMFDSNHLEYRIEPLLNYYQPLIDWLHEWKQNE
nr:angiotensin-converting enzyme-like [Dermatophagoides farinae]